MLVNPEFNSGLWKSIFEEFTINDLRIDQTPDEFVLYLRGENGWEPAMGFQKHSDGVFWTDMNPDGYLCLRYPDLYDGRWDFSSPGYYGVADTPEQIVNHPDYKRKFVDSADRFVLCVTPIMKADQPEHGGWRWHKWGTYIGDHEIVHEYLSDEDGIESVVVFHFYRLS